MDFLSLMLKYIVLWFVLSLHISEEPFFHKLSNAVKVVNKSVT